MDCGAYLHTNTMNDITIDDNEINDSHDNDGNHNSNYYNAYNDDYRCSSLIGKAPTRCVLNVVEITNMHYN